MQAARTDTVSVFAARIRQLKAERVELIRQISTARIDSIAVERHHAVEVDDLTRRLGWAEDQRPSWYEKPGLIAVVTALVTVWATLQAVQLSL